MEAKFGFLSDATEDKHNKDYLSYIILGIKYLGQYIEGIQNVNKIIINNIKG